MTKAKKIGRPKRLNLQQKKLLIQLKEKNADMTLRQLARVYAETTGEKAPCADVVSRALKEAGYVFKKTRKKAEVEEEEKKKETRYKSKHRELPKVKNAKRKSYPSDLSDSQWELIKPLFETEETRGRKRKYSLREVLNAIFYLSKTGCQWRYLPHDFPPWDNVSKTYSRWRENGQWEKVLHLLREKARVKIGREPTPSLCIIDSQSVKTTEKGGLEDLMQPKRSKEENGISS